jgi:hypothetical protein
MARRVTRVSRGIRLPVEQQVPVVPPPSVRDRVIYEPQWPEGVELDPGMAREPPTETMDVPWKLPRLSQRQEIATPRKRRRGLRPGAV